MIAFSVVAAPPWAFCKEETRHAVSHGLGVSSPAIHSSLSENPAGLAYIRLTEIYGALYSPNRQLNPMTYGGQAFFGEDRVGAGLGVFSDSSAQIGIAAQVPSLRTAFGASTIINLKGGPTDLTIGMILGIESDYRFGLVGYGILDGVQRVGAGFATELNRSATFAVDAGSDGNGNALGVKASLGIHITAAQINMGYGIHIDENDPSWVLKGISFGLGFKPASRLQMSLYYNHLAQYYLALGWQIP